ncbi:MAG: hypothetical protein ACKVI8_18215 [Paraglaciecola sp.]
MTIIDCHFGWLRHLASSKNATRMMSSSFYQDTHVKDSALLIKISPSTDGFPLTWAGGNSYN